VPKNIGKRELGTVNMNIIFPVVSKHKVKTTGSKENLIPFTRVLVNNQLRPS
jgi:hypothetical protein